MSSQQQTPQTAKKAVSPGATTPRSKVVVQFPVINKVQDYDKTGNAVGTPHDPYITLGHAVATFLGLTPVLADTTVLTRTPTNSRTQKTMRSVSRLANAASMRKAPRKAILYLATPTKIAGYHYAAGTPKEQSTITLPVMPGMQQPDLEKFCKAHKQINAFKLGHRTIYTETPATTGT